MEFEFIFHDVEDPFVIEVDDIYNLACAASPKIYQKDPRKTMKTGKCLMNGRHTKTFSKTLIRDWLNGLTTS